MGEGEGGVVLFCFELFLLFTLFSAYCEVGGGVYNSYSTRDARLRVKVVNKRRRSYPVLVLIIILL